MNETQMPSWESVLKKAFVGLSLILSIGMTETAAKETKKIPQKAKPENQNELLLKKIAPCPADVLQRALKQSKDIAWMAKESVGRGNRMLLGYESTMTCAATVNAIVQEATGQRICECVSAPGLRNALRGSKNKPGKGIRFRGNLQDAPDGSIVIFGDGKGWFHSLIKVEGYFIYGGTQRSKYKVSDRWPIMSEDVPRNHEIYILKDTSDREPVKPGNLLEGYPGQHRKNKKPIPLNQDNFLSLSYAPDAAAIRSSNVRVG